VETISLIIDGQKVNTFRGRSVLEAALEAGIYIPHLCYHPDLPPVDACQLCVVEIQGIEGTPTSCTTPATDGMVIATRTEKLITRRQSAIMKILAGHPPDCGNCAKYLNCELQALKQYLETDKLEIQRHARFFPVDKSNPLLIFDPNKCVLCTRCIRACRDLRGVGILTTRKQGEDEYIGTLNGFPLAESGCRFCGACAEVCPTGAIMDKEGFLEGKKRKCALLPCRYTCPAEIDVPGYLRFIREKNYPAAVALIREKVPFPAVLGYVCDHPCENTCRRGQINQSIAIRELKRFSVENDREEIWKNNILLKPAKDQRIGIIGAGPTGLTAAYFLAITGYKVTVFESLPFAGGMLRAGIPEYRLPRDILNREIREIEKLGVEIRTGSPVNSIDALFINGFNVILIATGTQAGIRLPVKGANSPGVFTGIEFLKRYNLGDQTVVGKRVIVIGGGNVAVDCARVARRLGAEQVQLTCLESREIMPASSEELEQAEAESIDILPGLNLISILPGNGGIKTAEFAEVESFSFDEDKNLTLVTRENSIITLEADNIIFAVGQKPVVPEEYGLKTTSNNLVEIDERTLATSREGVFAAGDVVTGTSSVIKAIASGRRAAIEIDKYLGGEGNIDIKLTPPFNAGNYLGLEPAFAAMQRVRISTGGGNTECNVPAGMSAKEADYEAKRCLQCDLRFKIKSVKIWSNF